MKKIISNCVLFLIVAAGSGCISSEKTVYRDAERAKVEFENDTAGRLFYETLNKSSARQNRSESKTEISLPIVFDHKVRTVDGDNLVFNSAVRRCDSNGNGKITEQEARIFSQNLGK
jgi:hypothetical protein